MLVIDATIVELLRRSKQDKKENSRKSLTK